MHRLLQYTLDLFEVSPERAPAPVEMTRPGARAALPEQTLEQVLAPMQFRHPQANRQVQLGGCLVAYALQRSRRRTIGFSVDAEGLLVRAPNWAPLHTIEDALEAKANWIVRKLNEMHERGVRQQAAQIDWRDGALLQVLGQPVQLVLAPSHRFARGAVEMQPAQAGGAADRLMLGLALDADPARIRDLVQAWLMGQARRNFQERLAFFAPQLGVQWRSLRLSSAQTRWGSASADGSIRLNWRLIHMSQAIIDYVVVHELAHLRVMDHSPQFWGTVGQVLPDYATRRGQLKQAMVPRW